MGVSKDPVHDDPFGAIDAANTSSSVLDRLNATAARSKLGKLFELKARKTTFTAELCAAFTVFLTVAQIIAVNPAILASSGGPCTVYDCTGPLAGTPECRDPTADPGYAACVAETATALVATTCISAAIGCFLMAFLANMPLILAPGMGVNAFFTFAMVGQYGQGQLTYQQAMAVVLVVALLVLVVAALGLRGRVMQLFPSHLVFAMVVGLGLFLAFTGLRSASGIGLVVADPSTLVTAGGCSEAHQVHAALLPGPNATLSALNGEQNFKLTESYGCSGGVMSSATTWLGIAATLLMVLLMAAKVKAAIAWGVLFATAIAWIPGHGASYFSSVPGSAGAARLANFKQESNWITARGCCKARVMAHSHAADITHARCCRQVVTLPNPSKTSLQFDFSAFKKSETYGLLFGMWYIVFLDATGTAFALAEMLNQQLPGFISPGFAWPRRMATLVSDALSCIPGALLGTSPLIVTIESSVAIEEGGRTGLVAAVTGCMFLVAMFFAPLFSNIPPYATGPALIVVGSLMVSNARFINWEDINQAFPSFVTIVLMPLTYSISNGLLGGIAATFALWLLETGLALITALLGRHEAGHTAGEVVHSRMEAWRTAFGDLTWDGYKSDVKQTFVRATSTLHRMETRLGRTISRTMTLSTRAGRGRSAVSFGPGVIPEIAEEPEDSQQAAATPGPPAADSPRARTAPQMQAAKDVESGA